MDGQMKLDICKAQVVRVDCSPEEWQRRLDAMGERQWQKWMDKITEFRILHEREALELADECDGQMELEVD